jgi:hypothetical protein
VDCDASIGRRNYHLVDTRALSSQRAASISATIAVVLSVRSSGKAVCPFRTDVLFDMLRTTERSTRDGSKAAMAGGRGSARGPSQFWRTIPWLGIAKTPHLKPSTSSGRTMRTPRIRRRPRKGISKSPVTPPRRTKKPHRASPVIRWKAHPEARAGVNRPELRFALEVPGDRRAGTCSRALHLCPTNESSSS